MAVGGAPVEHTVISALHHHLRADIVVPVPLLLVHKLVLQLHLVDVLEARHLLHQHNLLHLHHQLVVDCFVGIKLGRLVSEWVNLLKLLLDLLVLLLRHLLEVRHRVHALSHAL